MSEPSHVVTPRAAFRLRNIFRRAEPGRSCRETSEPENPPSELGIDIAREKPLDPRRRAARDDEARGFAFHKAMPEYRALSALRLYVAEFRTGKPRAVEESFQKSRHAEPPHGMDDHEMIPPLR